MGLPLHSRGGGCGCGVVGAPQQEEISAWSIKTSAAGYAAVETFICMRRNLARSGLRRIFCERFLRCGFISAARSSALLTQQLNEI